MDDSLGFRSRREAKNLDLIPQFTGVSYKHKSKRVRQKRVRNSSINSSHVFIVNLPIKATLYTHPDWLRGIL